MTILFSPGVYSFDEFTEHVNSLPFTLLSTDESVRTPELDDDPLQELILVHDIVLGISLGTVQLIIGVLPTVRLWYFPDIMISVLGLDIDVSVYKHKQTNLSLRG